MKTKKKLIFKNVMVGFLMCALILATLGTYAWFTDKKSFSSSNLEFGTIKLKVDGSSISGDNINVSISRKSGEVTGKIMPGDTVSLSFNVSLETGSDDAYYLAVLDGGDLFEKTIYYNDGTNVQISTAETKKVGSLSTDKTHTFSFTKTISEDYETQGASVSLTLNIYAIQQANLTEEEAFDEMYNNKITYLINGVSLNSVRAVQSVFDFASNFDDFQPGDNEQIYNTGIGFYYTSELSTLSGYSLNAEKTATFDSKLATFDQGKNLIQVYTNGRKLAYVSDYEMFAPVSCAGMFCDGTLTNSIKTIMFSNFNTSKVTDMRSMFYGCCAGTLDLSSFDTSNVTNMDSMFYFCYSLTTLSLSSFDTSNVTNMDSMFSNCSSLTTINLSSFDTSNVTNMGDMFSSCSKLTTITVSDKWVINEGCDTDYMFLDCGTDHVTVKSA